MSSIKVRKVGNSLGFIFPKEIKETLNISEGDIIDITPVGKNKVLIDSHLPHHSQWTFPKAKLNKEDQEWIEAELEDDDETPSW